MARWSRFSDERLELLYESDSFGGESTMRAKVIRELIDDLRQMRRDLAEMESLIAQIAEARASLPGGAVPAADARDERPPTG